MGLAGTKKVLGVDTKGGRMSIITILIIIILVLLVLYLLRRVF